MRVVHLTSKEVTRIRKLYGEGLSIKQLSQRFGVSTGKVGDVVQDMRRSKQSGWLAITEPW